MVQPKHKKSKPKKHNNAVNKHGNKADLTQLRSQLDALGLKIIQVTADGNCFFRALADQLEGNEEEHRKYRDMVVQYISSHCQDFEPFIEDDVPFDDYCQSMGKDGTWAGHMELQAASLVTKRNICIHQALSPRWYIRNFSGHDTNMIHLSYHDSEHYNSVRLKEDSCEGPSNPIIIKVDVNISATDKNKKLTANELKATSWRSLSGIESVKLVMAGTGCENIDKVEQVLREVDGDADAAIEFMIAERESDENLNCIHGNHHETNGDQQNGSHEQPAEATGDMACERKGPSLPDGYLQSVRHHGIKHNEKKIARTQECSCGTKRKCEACCSSAVQKSSAAPIINNSAGRKGRKETKQSRKRESRREVAKHQSEYLPDVGALCI